MRKYGIMIVILFIIAIGLVFIFHKNNDFVKTGSIYISEIVASNSYTYKDNDGEYSDYIEIYNGYNHQINLLNYRISDSIYEVSKWSFPDITIEPHEYFILFASGKNKCLTKNACHTNFKLKSEGETISLIDDTGNIISRVTFKKLMNDEAYSYVNGNYYVTIPTPGKMNSEQEIKRVDAKDKKIRINEYLSHNKGSNYANDSGYYDWVELYNYGDKDVSVEGLFLSDEESNLNKFRLPDKVIKKNDYLVIYLTGGVTVNDEITANFKLSDNDDKIILSANGEIIDKVNVVKLDKNVSYGKKGDKWLYFYTPTPGRENSTHGVEKEEKNGNT